MAILQFFRVFQSRTLDCRNTVGLHAVSEPNIDDWIRQWVYTVEGNGLICSTTKILHFVNGRWFKILTSKIVVYIRNELK